MLKVFLTEVGELHSSRGGGGYSVNSLSGCAVGTAADLLKNATDVYINTALSFTGSAV